MIANILIVGGTLWIFLSILSFMQFVRLRDIYNVLSEKGRIVTGQDRGLFRTKYRFFAAVSNDGIVTDVRVLKVVRFVTPPKVFEYPRLIGSDLNGSDVEALDAEPRIQQAVKNLKLAWAKTAKQPLKPNMLSIAPGPGTKTHKTRHTGEQRMSANKFLGRAENEIRKLAADDELN